MKKLNKNWKGLVPEYYEEVDEYIRKNFLLSKFQNKYPNLFDSSIDLKEQGILVMRIIFSLARQIPADWRKTNIMKIIDPYIIIYLREFVWDCFLNYREGFCGLEDDTYDRHFSDILEILDKLYITKNGFTVASTLIFDENFNKKYNNRTKIYEKARFDSSKDSNKIVNTNAKVDNEIFPLDLDEILYGTKKPTSQCHYLKDYINKKYAK